MPLVCFIQMRIFIYLRFCVFWGFPLSLVWRFCFAVNLATFSLTYYAGRLMALSKKKLSLCHFVWLIYLPHARLV